MQVCNRNMKHLRYNVDISIFVDYTEIRIMDFEMAIDI